MKFVVALAHPAVFLSFMAVSMLLWMPFGVGYYDSPLDSRVTRIAIRAFAYGFVVLALVGCVSALRPRLVVNRLVVASLALVVALLGVGAMLWWLHQRA